MSNGLSVSEIGCVEAMNAVGAVLRSGASVSVLVYGLDGGGQHEVAERLACGHLCMGEDERPCGVCKTCGAYTRGNSADLLRVEPEGKSDLISVGAVSSREGSSYDGVPIADFLRVGPLVAPLKVVLIHEAERMTDAASNALLKTLEEPPEYARFVLSTGNLSRLLPTIVSRCLLIGCDLPDESNLPRSIAALSGGTNAVVLQLSEERFIEFVEDFSSWVHSLAKRSAIEAMRLSSDFQSFAEKYQELAKTSEDKDKADRAFRAEFLTLFANALGYELRKGESRLVRLAELVVEGHASVQGNVRFDFVCDSMFATAFQPG
ncbi:MAG: hypothetical protein KIT74_01505 [Fimbriimonadales bacterium]|nr:hypothetical protein [Fimbriimonadales bacterium]